MKKKIKFEKMWIILAMMGIFAVGLARAQEDVDTIRTQLVKQQVSKKFLMTFQHYYEPYKANKAGVSYEEQALLYGFGVHYEYDAYQGPFGWGGGLGFIQGTAVAGNSSNTSLYFQKRVSWQSIQANVRVFRRFNAFFELGPTLILQSKSLSWPSSQGYTVDAASNPSYGFFLEARSRLNTQFDVFQSIGLMGKSRIAAWRLGGSYNF